MEFYNCTEDVFSGVRKLRQSNWDQEIHEHLNKTGGSQDVLRLLGDQSRRVDLPPKRDTCQPDSGASSVDNLGGSI